MSILPLSRLRAQKISGTSLPVADLVSYMGAMQAQDYYAALWAIGLRTGTTEREIIAAIEAQEIVRTWTQRGTIHFVTPQDAAWMTALSAPRTLSGIGSRHERLGLNQKIAEYSQSLDLLHKSIYNSKFTCSIRDCK